MVQCLRQDGEAGNYEPDVLITKDGYVVTIPTLKSALWIGIIFLLAMSFPIQVALFSPLPSLFPYIGLALLFFLAFRTTAWPEVWIKWNLRFPTNFVVCAYVVLVCFQTSWQTLFGFVPLEQGISAIIIYCLPVAFYVYFQLFATDQEIRVVLAVIAVAGLVVGLYFVYDAYSMIVIHRVNDFALRAYEYSQFRANSSDINTARIAVGNRSHGLLELHAVSAAWVALGCFAALAMIRSQDTWQRAMVIMIYGIMLLIALNCTAVFSFALIIFLMECQGSRWFVGHIAKPGLKIMMICVCSAIVMGLLISYIVGDVNLFIAIWKTLEFQIDLVTGNELISENGLYQSYFGKLVSGFLTYPSTMQAFPPGMVIGDGFTSGFGVIKKGGDYGILETLYRFGPPLFIAVIVGLFRLIFISLRELKFSRTIDQPRQRYLLFSVCVTSYLLLTEIHYSVWSAKSVFPIFFISLALYGRSVTLRHQPQKLLICPSPGQPVHPA